MSEEQLKIQWRQQNEPIGKELGYPQCCIDAFCNQPPHTMKNKQPTEEDQIRLEASYINNFYTGFIPCIEHAKDILWGKTTLPELIQNRSLIYPAFPLA